VLKKFRNVFFKPEGLEHIETANSTEVSFEVRYGSMVIGHLEHKAGIWTFAYSEQFKLAPGMRPIVDFPDVTKEYKEQSLWPFFASRIPSLENAHVKQTLAEKKVSENDEAGLLRLFGFRTITNPLELVATS
jgi:HipA-like protein